MSVADISQWTFRDFQSTKRPKFVQIAATATGFCALDADGWCWRYVDKREMAALGLNAEQAGWYQFENDIVAYSTVTPAKGKKR